MGRQTIIITEIPYQVNKAKLLEKIAEMVRLKRIDGVSDMRDESDRDGMRIVIELRRDAVAQVVLNQLYANTQLQTTFGVIMLALVGFVALVILLLPHIQQKGVRATAEAIRPIPRPS